MAFADRIQAQGSDACPECGAPLVLRLAGGQGRPRRRFWGCSTFPVTGCRGVRAFDANGPDVAAAWPRPAGRRDRGHDRSMTRVALAAVVAHDEPREVPPPRLVSDAPSARAARHRAALGRGYHRRLDARMARIGDRWPLMLMAYVGFAGGSVMATAWIHPAIAGVALMAMTALFIEALLRPPSGSIPTHDVRDAGPLDDDTPPRPPARA
jgi:hypothetical protein